jgi:8-oxo-dGTP pyrophosphatase MutT (NUDIX family)
MSNGQREPNAANAASNVIDWRSRIRECLASSAPVHDRDQWLVPGRTLEQSHAFINQFPREPVAAAVLIPLVEREDGLTVLLTERSSALKNHAGQISFPGGRIEPEDRDPRAAALREAHEEIGLEERFVSVAGYLPDHVIISGFLVTPVVAFVQPGFELRLDPSEVQSTFEVPIDYVFDKANHKTRRRKIGGSSVEIDVLDIPFGNYNIWGATAGMLVTLHRLCMEGPAGG